MTTTYTCGCGALGTKYSATLEAWYCPAHYTVDMERADMEALAAKRAERREAMRFPWWQRPLEVAGAVVALYLLYAIFVLGCRFTVWVGTKAVLWPG